MGRQNFKPGALTAPLPAVMVSVGDMENSNIITIGWTGILSTIPPRTYISVRPERHSFNILMEKREFVINLAPSSLAKAVDYAGIYTGAKVDKFEKLKLTKLKSKEVEAPTIAECPLALECKVIDVKESGTHHVFVADIVSVSCDDGIIDAQGKICYDKADLIAYMHGEYYSVGEKLGKFGFSTDKQAPERKKAPTEAKKEKPWYYDVAKKGKRGGKRR